jgi:tetratricopeptide (TPR) repeat protein
MKILLPGIFLFLYTTSYTQVVNIDSLKKALQKTKPDSASILANLKTMFRMTSENAEAKFLIGNWAMSESEKINFYEGVAKTNYNLGVTEMDLYNSPAAITYLSRAVEQSEKYNIHKILGLALDMLGQVYKMNHQYDKAISYTQKAIDVAESNKNERGLGIFKYNLATLIHDSATRDNRDNNKVAALMENAINHLQKAADTPLLIHVQTAIAIPYAALGQGTAALEHLRDAERFITALNRPELYTAHYYHKGLSFTRLKNYTLALSNLNNAVDFATRYNDAYYKVNSYKALAEVHDSLHQYATALSYNNRYLRMHDSLHDKEKFTRAATIENRFQQAKKDKEIFQLNNDKQIAAARRSQLTRLLLAAISGFVILGVLVFFLQKNIRARKKAYHALEEKSELIQQQALKLSKQAKLIAQFQSQMNPHFVYNALQNIQGAILSSNSDKANNQVQSLAQLMRKTFDNAEKDAILLQEEIAYLNKYIDFEKASFPVPLQFDVAVKAEADNVFIPPMMIQPFLENAIKHAGLKKITNPHIALLIEAEEDLLAVTIRDNGAGMKPSAFSDKLSHSLSVILSRLELLFQGKQVVNGKPVFSIKTVPEIDAGTQIKFYLPLQNVF